MPSSKVETIMNQLPNDINAQKDTFENNIRKGTQSELNNFTESYREEDKDNLTNETTINASNNDVADSYNGIVCFHCKDSFETQEMFENHKMLCDEDEVMIQAPKKPDTSSKESSNIELINLQFVEKICNVCNKHFESEKHFTEHLSCCKFSQEEHYQVSDKLSSIKDECITYKNVSSIDIVTPIETDKKCGHCEVIYSTKKELLNHIAKCHEGQPLFKCITCNRSYEKWSGLDVHEATHRVDKPYLCDLCGKSFKHSNNLRGHKRIHLDDSKKKRHVCEICRKAFRSR